MKENLQIQVKGVRDGLLVIAETGTWDGRRTEIVLEAVKINIRQGSREQKFTDDLPLKTSRRRRIG